MEIRKALPADLPIVRDIVQETIRTVYPHYYPAGAVAFFQAHHSDNSMCRDIADGIVWLGFEGAQAVGTVTIRENEILRLFVLPQYQKRGYGRALLTFAEAEISRHYPEILIDASLPAKAIYLKHGYRECGYHTLPAGEDFLCYDQMVRKADP